MKLGARHKTWGALRRDLTFDHDWATSLLHLKSLCPDIIKMYELTFKLRAYMPDNAVYTKTKPILLADSNNDPCLPNTIAAT